MKNKGVFISAIVTVLILLVPFVAMFFTEDVDWNIADFIIMGTLIFITGLGINWAINTKNRYRYIIAGVILFGFLLLWAELAVGVFNSPIAGS
jgi:hypothetical protein